MAKTVAQLQAENEELKKQLANAVESEKMVEENNQLKAELEKTREDKAASEAKLMAEISAMGENEVTIENGVVVGTNIKVMKASEYDAYSRANGRIFGRPKNVKTECTIEELRALINSDWTPSMIMDKHGIDGEEFKQLVWKLSKRELRDTPIKFDLKRDTIRKG